MKRILVIGGTGRTGRHVIDAALAAGMAVNVLARRPEAITQSHANLTVFQGTPENAGDIGPAIAGCDAVIATMNNARASDSPFAKIVNAPTLLTDCFSNIVSVMKEHNIRRVIHLSAFGAGNSAEAAPWIFRQFINRTNLGVAYRDHEGVEALLAASGLDWTAARPAGLSDKQDSVRESYLTNGRAQPKPSMTIGRHTVAKWLVDAVDRKDVYGKTPILSGQ